MLNKMLIKMIIERLLKDIFCLTFIKATYIIKNRKTNFEIIVNATLNQNTVSVNKYRIIRIESWVELITNYNNIREKLRIDLIDNIREEQKC